MVPDGPHEACMAPHQPSAPVKALEGRATSNEAAACSHAAATQAWDAQTAADGTACQNLPPRLACSAYKLLSCLLIRVTS